MEPYDIVMIVVLAGAVVFGFIKGLAWQIASLGSIILSYFLALKFSTPLASMFGSPPWNRFAAMLAIYVATSFVVWMGFRYVAGAMDRIRLREFDRQLGALAGAAKGVLVCVAITFFAVTLSESARSHVLKSRSGHYIALLLDHSEEVMPEELHQVLRPYMDRLEHELEPTAKEQPSATSGGGQARWPFNPTK